MDLGDCSLAAGAQLVLHLHRFDHDHWLARIDAIAGFHEHADDFARHGRDEPLRAGSGGAASVPTAVPEPAAGVLAFGCLFAAAYYACCEPASFIGRCLTTAANASVAVQPITGLATLVVQASHQAVNPQETASMSGSPEECIPEEPQPVAVEAEPVEIAFADNTVGEAEPEAAPIVIHEETVEELPVPSTIEISGLPACPDAVCPMVMPYCADDEQAALKPIMPYAEDNDIKPVSATKESEDKEFKEWMKLFEESDQSGKDNSAEELPEPKCQEDSHIHEHYSGCPSTTCPYTGKSYPSRAPATKPGKKSGKEGDSEPTVIHHRARKHSIKGYKDKGNKSHTDGIDTMEYRPSDGNLNEYGRGPL